MEWHKAIAADAVAPGKQRIVSIEGKEVGIFFEGGNYYAILNFCPHAGAPVCRGFVQGVICSDESGKLTYDEDRKVLRCPWHRWEFELATGQAVVPIKPRLRTYPVERRDDWLYVRI